MSRMAEHYVGDKPIAYRETSRKAWREHKRGELDRLILETIEAAGDAGIICADIEQTIGREHQAVSGNLRHLAEDGLVESTGTHGLTPRGRKAIKWRIARA